MLPKVNRIQSSKEFTRIFKKTRPVFTANLSLRVLSNSNARSDKIKSRFAFVVSNKVDRRAARRNALKRQLREISRTLISQLNSSYDIVVFVKKDFFFPYDQNKIKEQFCEGLLKAKVISNEKNSN